MLSDLTPETIYYFSAFATNSEGTSLGEVKQFTTLEALDLPTIVTIEASEIEINDVILNGNITSDGGTEITQRGFYWSATNTSPNTSDNNESVSGTTGEFNFMLSGLTPETTYYFRAFATNSEGTALGEVKQFTTLQETTLAELPFYDDFKNEYENWQTTSIEGVDQWHLSGDDGIDGGTCARFYITSNPKQTNDDWLISQTFNTKGLSNIIIEFKFLFHGDGITPEFYYSNSLNDDISKTEWTKIDNSFWENAWSWNSALIEIENPGETFVFAIRYQSSASKDNYILMDDFSIKAKVTDAPILSQSENEFKIYPNPLTNTSIISFTNTISGKVNLSIFDLQGRKICTVLDRDMPQGKHTVSLGNQINVNGIYFCTLTTETDKKTLKLVVNE